MKNLMKLFVGMTIVVWAYGLVMIGGEIGKTHVSDFIGTANWLTIGFLAYFPLHVIFRRLIVLYVFSHELTHALWSMLFGGKVDEIYVSRSKGGYTTYTKGNMLVTLAPYFFPLYALVFMGLYAVVEARVKPAMLFMVGLGLGFHILLTLYSIRVGQPDLKRSGVLFSLVVIVGMNVAIMGMVVAGCLGGKEEVVRYLRGGAEGFRELRPMFAVCGRHVADGARMVMRLIFPPMQV